MKKMILILALVSIGTLGFSQGRGKDRPEPPSAEEMIAKATKELSLTDQQVNEWKAIHEKYEDDMKEESTRREMGKELEATLTEEQLKKFKEMISKRPQRPRRN